MLPFGGDFMEQFCDFGREVFFGSTEKTVQVKSHREKWNERIRAWHAATFFCRDSNNKALFSNRGFFIALAANVVR